jgi:Putative F0F1-ATPase subunit Ca2+/Mg2+ transporter
LGNRNSFSPAALTLPTTRNKLLAKSKNELTKEERKACPDQVLDALLRFCGAVSDTVAAAHARTNLGPPSASAGRFLVPSENDDRPPMVVGMHWVQQITSIAIEMALPAWLGRLADQHWGTEPWLVSVGAVLGFSAAMVHLIAIAKRSGPTGRRRAGREKK